MKRKSRLTIKLNNVFSKVLVPLLIENCLFRSLKRIFIFKYHAEIDGLIVILK